MQQIVLAIGSDHAGYEYKNALINVLNNQDGYLIKDFGTFGSTSVDYPDFAHPTAQAINKGEASLGILVCGSANGVAITANKYPCVRAAVCWNEAVTQLARQHNNANVICIPARFISLELCIELVHLFLKTSFEGGRHNNRVDKINHIKL
ncbi:MAG: ribose 5-phosphate isomerase B [Phycisphaerales bacterium]|nr:ribose 5-phosphate isomerase B [Phycisphaerales bacterium]